MTSSTRRIISAASAALTSDCGQAMLVAHMGSKLSLSRYHLTFDAETLADAHFFHIADGPAIHVKPC